MAEMRRFITTKEIRDVDFECSGGKGTIPAYSLLMAAPNEAFMAGDGVLLKIGLDLGPELALPEPMPNKAWGGHTDRAYEIPLGDDF